MRPRDQLGRPLGNLRLSVTDRCNLRCAYCMPEEDYAWLPRPELLTFEEIDRVVDAFVSIGVTRVRLTGGEPLLRRDLPDLVRLLTRKSGLADVALTTNGILLADQARALKEAGLHRITVSLDTLQPARFRDLTRRDDHARVLAGIAALHDAGFQGTKLDTVVLRGVNDDELDELLAFAATAEAELRFIEYMDVGGATKWSRDDVVSRREILSCLEQIHGPIEAVIENSSAPAARYRLSDGRVFGIISSTTEPFCRSCDRSRLTADGRYFLCLYARQGLDLRQPLRSGADIDELSRLIAAAWTARNDRGAELRLAESDRAPLADAEELRRDPHLEMHKRGG